MIKNNDFVENNIHLRHSPLFMAHFALFLMLFAGCGKAQVTGKVTFSDGTPLTTGTVVFTKPRFQSGGTLNAQGEYRLSSYKPNDGTQKGEYKVYITGAEMEPEKEGEDRKPLIDAKFMSPETSGLICNVKGSTAFDIKVEKPGQVIDNK